MVCDDRLYCGVPCYTVCCVVMFCAEFSVAMCCSVL